MLRIPHCLDNRLTDGGKIASPTQPPHFTHQKHYYFNVSSTHFCSMLSKPQGLVRPEGLGKFKKSPQRVSNPSQRWYSNIICSICNLNLTGIYLSYLTFLSNSIEQDSCNAPKPYSGCAFGSNLWDTFCGVHFLA
jgi:hypothetical protein